MMSPLDGGYEWLLLDEVDSTQKVATESLRKNENVGVVLARNQTKGVGRFGRPWISAPDESLTMTMLFRQYAAHPRPHLVGMTVALAAASVLHCKLQWPNDLVIHGRKLGGILTELVPDPSNRPVPLVGLGVNLNQSIFPEEISARAVSLSQAHGGRYEPKTIAEAIVERLATLPDPQDWSDIAAIWALFDATPGKKYVLPSGEEAVAIAVGSGGQLMCSVAGESHAVFAGDAVFGEIDG